MENERKLLDAKERSVSPAGSNGFAIYIPAFIAAMMGPRVFRKIEQEGEDIIITCTPVRKPVPQPTIADVTQG
jgi:hypothetical protein